MTTTDLYVLEWIQRSNLFHIQAIEDTLRFNRRLYSENKATVNDWRMIHVGTRDECSIVADNCRHTLNQRDHDRTVEAL